MNIYLVPKSDTSLRTADICKIASKVIHFTNQHEENDPFPIEERVALLEGLEESLTAYEHRFLASIGARFLTCILRFFCFCYAPQCQRELIAVKHHCKHLISTHSYEVNASRLNAANQNDGAEEADTQAVQSNDSELMAFVQKYSHDGAPALFEVYHQAIRNQIFFDSLAQKYGFELLSYFEKNKLTYLAIHANAPSSMLEQLVQAGGKLDQDVDAWDCSEPLIHSAIDARAWDSVDYLIKKMPALLSVQKGYTGDGCMNSPKKWRGPTVEERLKSRA